MRGQGRSGRAGIRAAEPRRPLGGASQAGARGEGRASELTGRGPTGANHGHRVRARNWEQGGRRRGVGRPPGQPGGRAPRMGLPPDPGLFLGAGRGERGRQPAASGVTVLEAAGWAGGGARGGAGGAGRISCPALGPPGGPGWPAAPAGGPTLAPRARVPPPPPPSAFRTPPPHRRVLAPPSLPPRADLPSSSDPSIQARKSGVFSHFARVSINPVLASTNPPHGRQRRLINDQLFQSRPAIIALVAFMITR